VKSWPTNWLETAPVQDFGDLYELQRKADERRMGKKSAQNSSPTIESSKSRGCRELLNRAVHPAVGARVAIHDRRHSIDG